MAEPGDVTAAGPGGYGQLRASHADREHTIKVLKAAFVQGRLDEDELDVRVGQALASRTYADLAALTADIPAQPAGARPPEPARESVSKKAVAAVAGATAAFIGIWPVMMITPDGSPFAIPVIVVFIVLGMAVPTGWLLLLHDWLDKNAGRQPAQGLPPGTGGGASRRSAPAARATQLPQTGHGLEHTAEATQSRHPRLLLPGMRPLRRGHFPECRYALGHTSH
jgi:Domain of unknown function (DUF1707)